MKDRTKIKPTSAPEMSQTIIQAVTGKSSVEETARKKPIQINFQVSEELADIISEGSMKYGGTRPFIANILKSAGYDVPELDLVNRNAHKRRSRR